eukprot:GILK01009407.1.p1 GENE.GILK01009407.1~~GILK01009407.1.p1  ORF type:complete len:1148 (+),score=247.81 GILK01009407.1:126-3569(+)
MHFQPNSSMTSVPPSPNGTSYRNLNKSMLFNERSMTNSFSVSNNDNFKVVIRTRPPLPRELDAGKRFRNIVQVDESMKKITMTEYLAADPNFEPVDSASAYTHHVFTFDHVYDQDSSQAEVYDTTAQAAVMSTLEGYNATILAYGQTGTGKTHTMEGFTFTSTDEARGITPRAMEEIFKYIENCSNPHSRFLVRASYLQIYNEVISDLLKPERTNLNIREDKRKGVFVEGLSEWVVRSPAEIYSLIQRGAMARATASTKMNDVSSRSHAVFIIIVEQSVTAYHDPEGNEVSLDHYQQLLNMPNATRQPFMRQSFKVGKLNLVDLAGSERVRLTGATGRRLEESKKINQSLSALGNVIAALTDTKGRQHIPYRDSKLTRLLEDSLGGNCRTTMMAMISPAMEAFTESISTLKFANRAKNIKNEPRVNEDLDQKALLRKYEIELKKLRSELDEKSRNVVDKRKLLELEEERRRAEADKLAAITALEARSREFMIEKEEKRKLEERIKAMSSQLLIGGKQIQDTPQFRTAVLEQQRRIRQEYEAKLAELERERHTIEEDKAQVDRYKQLLLKQRDIMIALTARLNERDESIIGLQEEIDAYDRSQRELEDSVDQKTAAIIALQRLCMEHNIAVSEQAAAMGPGSFANNGSNGDVHGAGTAASKRMDNLRDRLDRNGSGLTISTDSILSRTRGTVEKRYSPSTAPVIFGSDQIPSESSSLSAEEKIQELSSLLESQKSEMSRLMETLEDIQAEKVALESRLLETRDGRTQRDRMGTSPSSVDSEDRMAMRRLEEENQNLKRALMMAKNNATPSSSQMFSQDVHATVERLQQDKLTLQRQLESALKSAANTKPTGSDESVATLQLQNDRLMKERQGLASLLEQNVATLVDKISRTVADISSASANPTNEGLSPSTVLAVSKLRLTQDTQALQKLIQASVSTLKLPGSSPMSSPIMGGSNGSTPTSMSSTGANLSKKYEPSSTSIAGSGLSLPLNPSSSSPTPSPLARTASGAAVTPSSSASRSSSRPSSPLVYSTTGYSRPPNPSSGLTPHAHDSGRQAYDAHPGVRTSFSSGSPSNGFTSSFSSSQPSALSQRPPSAAGAMRSSVDSSLAALAGRSAGYAASPSNRMSSISVEALIEQKRQELQRQYKGVA